jgi:precorrin-6B methylase 2
VVVANVPFVDVIGSMLDATVPWTAYEWDEWGDPHEPAFFHYMLSYSPYHNVASRSYPHMLVTTGLNDPRVQYWEPAKYVARMRRLKTNNTTLLLKTYLTGHMGASGRFDALSELCFEYAFVIDKLGLIPTVTAQKPLLKVISTISITPPDLLAMFQGYQVTMTLCAALDLGIFDLLHSLPNFSSTVPEVAKSLKVSEIGVARLMSALAAVGLLIKEGDLFGLTDVAASHLVTGMPGYIGELRFTLANELLWKATRHLPEAVRRGQPVKEVPARALMESIAQHNLGASRHAALGVLQALSLSDARKKHLQILDLCCGNGVVGFTLAKTERLSKNVRVHCFDTNTVLAITRQTAAKMGVEEKVEYIEGDAVQAASYGGPYDLILVGQNVLSACDTDVAVRILEKVSDALKSAGRVVLNETVAGMFAACPPKCVVFLCLLGIDQAAYAQLYSVAMFATRKEGKINSLGWYKQVLARAGFSAPTIHDLRPFPEKLLICSRNLISKRTPGGAKATFE